jgi:putative addiction module killer protein
VYEVQLTDEFEAWLEALRDRPSKLRIVARIRRATLGNLGDWRPVDGPISEMRVDCGPGYRLYFVRRKQRIIVLLAGGDKTTQARDIRRAQTLLKLLSLDHE